MRRRVVLRALTATAGAAACVADAIVCPRSARWHCHRQQRVTPGNATRRTTPRIPVCDRHKSPGVVDSVEVPLGSQPSCKLRLQLQYASQYARGVRRLVRAHDDPVSGQFIGNVEKDRLHRTASRRRNRIKEDGCGGAGGGLGSDGSPVAAAGLGERCNGKALGAAPNRSPRSPGHRPQTCRQAAFGPAGARPAAHAARGWADSPAPPSGHWPADRPP